MGPSGYNSLSTQVTFVVMDHEIVSTVISTVPLLWHYRSYQFLAEVNATSTGKLLDNLPRNDAVVELYSDKVKKSTKNIFIPVVTS
jgi:hypothetical protein